MCKEYDRVCKGYDRGMQRGYAKTRSMMGYAKRVCKTRSMMGYAKKYDRVCKEYDRVCAKSMTRYAKNMTGCANSTTAMGYLRGIIYSTLGGAELPRLARSYLPGGVAFIRSAPYPYFPTHPPITC